VQGVHFRVWAPRARTISVVLEGGAGAGSAVELTGEAEGYFSGLAAEAKGGSLYRFQIDARESFADPASRFQPEGPHGPSEVIDPAAFEWTDGAWTGPRVERPLLYELHVGTFTREGNWAAAQRRLPHLARLGVSIIEIMPIADFVGRFGWGYDGVNLFAPTRLYGHPDDLRRFVDAAHALGIGVILDVVYNHFGPDGCSLRAFAEAYFAPQHTTDWGEAINYDGADSKHVREYFLANAAYWIEEFHLDGLRLDATQNIYDDSVPHIITEIVQRARAAARTRRLYLVGENESQLAWLLRDAPAGGAGLDCLWNDDFHHSARVALTGSREAYYTDYRGTPQELISATRWGFLYQGQHYQWQEQRRGTPAYDLLPTAFVHYLENHDQVANSRAGERLHTIVNPGRLRALTALLLLGPATPLLFQGQEFASTAPFLFFADQKPELAESVRAGRKTFLRQFPSLATPESQLTLPDPLIEETFKRCHLDWSECERNVRALALHGDLIRLGREDATLRRPGRAHVHGAVLADAAFVLRFLGEAGDDRLLLINLGPQLLYAPSPEPLLAPPERASWSLLWSSEAPRYGGSGTPPLEQPDGWHLPAESAVLLASHIGDVVEQP
jgi:maltooligosyltrehalose trehalohydrolase